VISTWSSGTGGAGVIGAVSYAGLTLVLSTENTLLVMLAVPLLQAITFWYILKHPAHTKIPITKNGIDSQEEIIKIPKKTFKDKINLVPGLLKYMIPLGLVYLFEYFINQGLVTTFRCNHYISSLHTCLISACIFITIVFLFLLTVILPRLYSHWDQ